MANDTTTEPLTRARRKIEANLRVAGWLEDYRPLPGVPDELMDKSGRPRRHWLTALAELASYSEVEFRSRFGLAARHIRDSGASYRIYGEETERSWPLDPLPLILPQTEWEQIAAGVAQRALLMEAILADVYGEARLVTEGAIPAAVITGSPDFLRQMRAVKPPGGRYLQIYAADLGRGPDGNWWVLGDRTQAPSGVGYALENRLVVSRAFPHLYNSLKAQRLAPFFDALRRSLTAAADRSEPRICLLTPGPFSETYFEQAHLARYLGFLLVEGADLVARDGKVYVRTIAGLKRADAILRRVDADFLDPLELNAASHLGTPGMLEAIRAGGVAMLNMPGSGVLESRALLGFIPSLARRYLGENLKLHNVATWWCGQGEELAEVEANIGRMAIAPAFNAPGGDPLLRGPRLVNDLTREERAMLSRRMADRPGDFVAQEVVSLSTMPVFREGRVQPAPFVLRVYAAMTDEGVKIMPGGFVRISDQPDARAISMGEGARTADVWVTGTKSVERFSLLTTGSEVKVRRIMGHLPSRAADNLFWLGRYIERAEAALRLVRSLCTSLMAAESAVHATGETFVALREVLIEGGALNKKTAGGGALEAARHALHDTAAWGSVTSVVRAARRTASGMRERLSGDFWTLLLDLEADLASDAGAMTSEAQVLQQVERALQRLAALSGLTQENMNRVAGWRFLDMGRRIERGINVCTLTRTLAHDAATIDDLDLLLDVNDSQITYRARYVAGLALAPVRDLVMLDPYNTRSLAFQLEALKEHLAVLPTLQDDGMLEPPGRILLPLVARVEAENAADLSARRVKALGETLMKLSNAISERFFLQGASAVPTVKLTGLA